MNPMAKIMSATFYDDYLKFTDTTARYPDKIERAYLALGLCDETCDELASAWERKNVDGVFLELGDTQWYAARIGKTFGWGFGEIVNAGKSVYSDILLAGSFPSVVEIAAGRRFPSVDAAIAEMSKNAGAVAGRIKKYERDGTTWRKPEEDDFREKLFTMLVRHVALSMVLIDALWRIDGPVGNYDDCLEQNAAKLRGRVARNTIRGDGDHR